MEPEFSIIVPNYNHAAFLKQRLDSILDQSCQDFELILLDDNSTDGSIAILKKYAANTKVSHFIVNDENSNSPFRQWEKGIKLARGRYIWIAESDDYCSANFLECIKKFILKSTSDPGLVYVQSTDVDEDGNSIFNRLKYTDSFKPNIWEHDFEMNGKGFVREFLKVKNVIPNASAVVFRKDLITDTFFDKDLLSMHMAGDWFFWIKLAEQTNIGFIHVVLNFFRNHKAVSRNHDNNKKMLGRVMEEKVIRTYLKNNPAIDQEKEWEELYKLWYRVNSLSSILKPAFYLPKSIDTSVYEYINSFLNYKLKAK